MNFQWPDICTQPPVCCVEKQIATTIEMQIDMLNKVKVNDLTTVSLYFPVELSGGLKKSFVICRS